MALKPDTLVAAGVGIAAIALVYKLMQFGGAAAGAAAENIEATLDWLALMVKPRLRIADEIAVQFPDGTIAPVQELVDAGARFEWIADRLHLRGPFPGEFVLQPADERGVYRAEALIT